jgi:tetratricopeptide (TPR) repeat protein
MKTTSKPPETESPHCQEPGWEELTLTVHDLGEALRSARQRSQKWLAWRQLNTTDEHGVNSVTPYTVEAVATLEAAYALDEGDCDVIHHLAIAYHAMAWDLELCEPNTASEAWEKALFYWRKLQACGHFWRHLCTKGETLGEEFDASAIEKFRRNLIEHLLEIHVDFVRYYYDLNRYDQASRHIELIRRARIPPAARKELEILVYEAMTSTVPNVVAEGRLGDALTMLDGFLSLIPSHLPALQSYLEITKRWLDQTAPSAQWQEILKLDERVLPRWNVLSTSEHWSEHPLARAALGDLASVLGGKHWARARSLRLQRKNAGQEPQALASEEYDAYERAISWLKKVELHIRNDPEAQRNLVDVLMCRAEFVTEVSLNTRDFDEAYALFEEALSSCQEAMKIAPDAKPLREFAASILNGRARRTLDSNHLDFSARLKSAEEDLVRAIQFAPENSVLQENLDRIRDVSELEGR